MQVRSVEFPFAQVRTTHVAPGDSFERVQVDTFDPGVAAQVLLRRIT